MIKLSEKNTRGTDLSFEIFPPKTEKGRGNLKETIRHLMEWKPGFISCTCSAGGNGAGQNLDICRMVEDTPGETFSVAHLTCIRNSADVTLARLEGYLSHGVEHVMALRGDLPTDGSPVSRDFQYAADLVRFIRKHFGDRFEIGIAGSPEGHVECASLSEDIRHLREKQDEGADFIITQLTFDMEQFRRWLDLIRREGVHLPVIAGVMPVLDRESVINICLSRNACAIPRKLAEIITRHWFDRDPEGNIIPEVRQAFREEGVRYSAHQIQEYRSIGVDGIHLYTMNRWSGADEILRAAENGD